jgi:hypothetical protein
VDDEDTVGSARRLYAPVGNLRLRGLCVEPVIAPGYAGVVTHLVDGDGRLWSLSDVLPADAARAVAAYEASATIGDASLSHRELCRAGLFVQGATGSADGRLGAGAGVRAVRAGSSEWREIASLWAEPLAAQVGRAFDGRETDVAALLFARGQVVGADGDALVLAVENADAGVLPVRFVAPTDHEALAYRDNLRLLARAPGLRLTLVARVLAERSRTAALLAVGDEGEGSASGPRLRLPASWAGRCNLGLDRLSRSFLSSAEPEPVRVRADDPPDPLEALRRRVSRVAIGGRATLPPSVLEAVEREAALLERRLMPRGAAALRALATTACAAERDARGARRAGDADSFASAWVAVMRYERAASRVLRLASWR